MTSADPQVWQNRSPGNLDLFLPEIAASDVENAVQKAHAAWADWRNLSLDRRIAYLRDCQTALKAASEDLAFSISLETGKPLREARGELGAVVAKIDLTIADAERWIADEIVSDGPHPARVRRRSRGPAAVIAPFNFPIHLGHGAAVAYLLAGNPVLFKPSPLAAVTGAKYAHVMQSALPPGVFELVQGWGETGKSLSLHPGVRAVCFTGSIPVGRALASALGGDYSKSLALELGGKNASIVFDDADLEQAAHAIAESVCLTSGQRCNATSRVLIASQHQEGFITLFTEKLGQYVPHQPIKEESMMGCVISEAAVQRYERLIQLPVGDWILPGRVDGSCEGLRGNYVHPAAVLCTDRGAFLESPLHADEAFCPIVAVLPFDNDQDAKALHNTTPFGLTASIFTESEERFRTLGDGLDVGNLYWNLPTTFSPSTLPFGGHGISGNGKPGGRGFIRFAAEDQAVQWKA
jgi:acyl-CoA reductase-like NAD-dependent aldehyde dehydrogenase